MTQKSYIILSCKGVSKQIPMKMLFSNHFKFFKKSFEIIFGYIIFIRFILNLSKCSYGMWLYVNWSNFLNINLSNLYHNEN
jgi:hypothetical protein